MIHSLAIIMTVSSIMLIRSGTEESLQKKRELWAYLKKHDLRIFLRIRWGIVGSAMNLPGKSGRKLSVYGYKLCQKIYGLTDPARYSGAGTVLSRRREKIIWKLI